MNVIKKLLGDDAEEAHAEAATELTNEVKEFIGKEVQGKIIKVSDKGWGFLSSTTVPFTRIFFHWTALVQETLHFSELTKGMKVHFILTYKEGRGYSALRVRVDESELEPVDGQS